MEIKLKGQNMKKLKLDPFAYYVYFGIVIVIAIFILLQYLVTTPFIQSQENMRWYRRFLYFDYMFLLFFSLSSVFIGIFLTYMKFEGGRMTGVYFVILGIVVFTLGFLYFDVYFFRPEYSISNVYQALVSVIATGLGFIAAIFVVASSMPKG